jgi:hypothetical protein
MPNLEIAALLSGERGKDGFEGGGPMGGGGRFQMIKLADGQSACARRDHYRAGLRQGLQATHCGRSLPSIAMPAHAPYLPFAISD